MDRIQRYTVREISLATGLSVGVVNYRIGALKITGKEFGLTYDAVKQIITYGARTSKKVDPKNVDRLKLQLRNDGYQIAK